MKPTGMDLFFEIIGIITSVVTVGALIVFIWYFIAEIIPELRKKYDSYCDFRDRTNKKLCYLEEEICKLKKGE